jgi:AcrR family transcriptional regulator
MHKQSYKEQERQRREDEILRVAGEMLAERGYANLNMDELAEVVGISKPTLYQHFKGKEELITQVIVTNMKNFSQDTVDMMDGTPLERLTNMMRVMAKGRYKSTQFWGAMNSETVWKAFRDNPTLVEHRQKFTEKLFTMINDAKVSGEISEALPTPLIARIIFCLQSAISDPHRQPDVILTDEELDQAVEDTVTIFLHGVCPYNHDEMQNSQTSQNAKVETKLDS